MAIFDCVDFSRVERVERGSDVVRRPSLASVCLRLFAAAALAFAGLSAKAADSLTMADFVYTNKLQVAGYTGSETLANFPVLVRISTSLGDFQYSRMRSSKGGDLAFFALDGTRLASEVDTWATSGTSLVWVKLPSMVQGTQFYMCYRLTDELAALDTMVENPNPWGDYVGVWHMRETGTSNPIADSSPNGLDGTTTDGEGVNESNGAIGRARRIAKDNNHAPGIIVDVNSDATKKAVADSLGKDFHASYWVRVQGNVSYSYMLGRRKGDYGYSWGVQFHENNPPPKVRIFSGGQPKTDKDAWAAGECTLTTGNLGSTLSDKTWRKVDVIWKDETNGGVAAYDFYIDGTLVESKDLVLPVNLAENANIGIGCSTQDEYGDKPATKKGRRLNGDMDEVRLRPGIVSADWIKADYDTVNNEAFVTPAQPEVTWVNNTGTSPGVDCIHHDYVSFAGTVTDCGGFPNCSIQCKVWLTGGTEPENWTTLTNGLVAADVFVDDYSGLAPDTAYSYKLRAAGGEGDVGSAPVTGTFTTLAGFAVAWSTATESTGLSEIHHDKVVVAGAVATLGDATSFEVQWKCWAEGASEPENWTTLTNVLGAAAFEVTAGELASGSTYNYALRAVANDGETTTPFVGTFTTLPGLTVEWDETAGIVQVGYNFAKIGGTVVGLGEATSCIVQRKIWAAGESEPDWETFKTGLVRNNSFTDVVSGLMAGTTYSYKLRAYGDDGETTEVVEGTFTTLGEEGETIGSDYTHFFSDGTNYFWVANSFERYLQFTVTGYEGTETLTNFPVLVEVRKDDDNGFSYDDFYHFDGSDIAFVDEKGHIIPHEIDTWNKNGMSLFWVRLPEMNNGTTFTMCYRSPLLEERPDPGNTFEKYVGVWHMNERENGVVNLKDSTVNNFETETHALSTAVGNGRIGYARRVAQTPGSSSSYGRIIAFDHDDILRTGVGNVFTFSGWYKLAATPPKWAYLVSRKSEDADRGWGIQYDETDSTTELRVWSGSAEKNKFQIFKINGMSSTGWNYWTFLYDGSVNPDGTTNQLFHAYLNGEEISTTVGGLQLNYPVVNDENATYDHLVIGGQQNGTGAFNGLVDEARYSKGMRSADWIKAEYNSSLQQVYWNDAGRRFVTKGTVSRGTDSLVPVVVWETGNGMPDTIVDVSYAYVQFAGTVTYCGAGAETCWIEYQLWADGQEPPGKDDWTPLLVDAERGTKFSIPVFGLKQDMPYNFRIRAVNEVAGERRQTRERAGSFRTNGNVSDIGSGGELLRVDNKFVHRFGAGEYTFTTPDYVTNIEIMVVGGGGAGGYKVGGGGGGGGLFYSESYPVTTNTTYIVAVGRGGIAASNLTERSGSGQFSTFALESNQANPLIEVPGGGGGGSYVNNETLAKGADGASGGGGTYAKLGGAATDDGIYGHDGGLGNDFLKNGSIGKVAAGGGGGAKRAGLGATFDAWSAGGAGGVGVANSMTGELLFYGAGGGGGYIYRTGAGGTGTSVENFTKPGAGGSGIGGDAADVRNGIPATSGVPNTGAGGGGGSSRGRGDGKQPDESDSTYWQGGNGGDGVVLISYEVHGRDPIAEEPRISMTRCNYVEAVNTEEGDDVAGIAKIDYRLYWAGMQTDLADIYVHYSTVSSNELDNADGGEWVKVAESSVGIGSLVFTPPAVGYTYWLRLVARKGANSYAHSEEIASFTVPAISLVGATWTESKTSPAKDYATVTYKLHETNEVVHLYCYWSENRAVLEGDEPPSGEGVFMLDLGANTNTNLSGKTTFTLPATEGLERNRTYYIRLASGDAQGIELFPSEEIVELDTKETPITILSNASWTNNVAKVNFTATVGKLDPEEIQLVALYSRVQGDVTGKDPETKESVKTVSLGFCSDLGLDVSSPSATFPLWSDVATNYYVRLALATNVVVNIPYSEVTNIVVETPYSVVTNIVEDPPGVFTTNLVETAEVATTNIVITEAHVVTNLAIIAGSYSQTTKEIAVDAVEPRTLLYIVTANPKVMCYGDEPLPLDYGLQYAGLTEGWGWEHKYGLEGVIACDVTSTSASGNYPITQGTLLLEKGGQEQTEEGIKYQYKLTYSGATYTITNAVFETDIEDVVTNYTGEAVDASALVKTLSGIRNEQPVTYLYRANGAGDWGEMPAFTNVGNYLVQFKASAPNHDEVRSSFKVTVVPAPLTATIENIEMDYTGSAVTPDFVTNVTGLVKGDVNPLTCEFREEAGEWQSEAPSFSLPGTYKIYFRASAPNHETAVTNCTVVVRGWDFKVNMDGRTGYEAPIIMGKPEWIVNNNLSGMTGVELSDNDTRYGALDAVCENGLRLWQNYVIERKDFSKRVVATIMQQGSTVDPNAFVVHFPDIEPLMGTGLRVQYRLDKKLRGTRTKSEFDAASFEIGELTGKYETNVPLGPHDPTGLYVFNIVFSPTNTQYEGQSVIASCTTIGVLRVSSALTNTVTVAPWLSMSVDSTNEVEVAVADVINPFSIGGGDTIHAYETDTGTFRMWERKDDGDWNAPVTVNTKGVSQSTAEESTFEPGKAFWLGRKSPGEYIYLVGRYTGEDYVFDLEGGTAEAPGHTLVANPTMYDVALNDLVFVDGEDKAATPADGDRIIFQDASGYQTIYFPHATTKKWGRNVPTKVGRRVQNVWTEDGTNTMGTGFWYLRTDQSTLKIKFGGAR